MKTSAVAVFTKLRLHLFRALGSEIVTLLDAFNMQKRRDKGELDGKQARSTKARDPRGLLILPVNAGCAGSLPCVTTLRVPRGA